MGPERSRPRDGQAGLGSRTGTGTMRLKQKGHQRNLRTYTFSIQNKINWCVGRNFAM